MKKINSYKAECTVEMVTYGETERLAKQNLRKKFNELKTDGKTPYIPDIKRMKIETLEKVEGEASE